MPIYGVAIRYGETYQDTILVSAIVLAKTRREALEKFLASKPGIDDIHSVNITESDETEIIE